jgi:hypothetical protein
MSIQKKTKIKSISLCILGASAWAIVFILSIHTSNAAQTFIQSYSSTSQLDQGIIVEISPNNSNYVEPVSQASLTKAYGVVVDSSEASVALNNSGSSNKSPTFVASSGHYNILVTDQDGPISPGDYLSVSSIDGIGMKANSSEPIVVAQALGSFTGSGATIGTDTLKKVSGGTQTVHIGLIEANINIEHNPLAEGNETDVPSFLRETAQSLSGKTVPAWRIYLGILVFLVVAAMSALILYSGVRSSLISIGRNPLSKKMIVKGLLQVIVTSLIILIIGIFGVYLLLKI